MSEERDNGKIILIATIICIIIGFIFVFRLDKKVMDIFNSNTTNKTPLVDTANNPELKDLPALPNMIVIYSATFLTKEITIKEGEVVTFYNVDANPQKVIGSDWQSAFIDKSGAFAKGDLGRGEYSVYLENKPNEILKIKVK